MTKSPTRTHSGGGRIPVKGPVRYGAPKTQLIDPGAVSKLGAHIGNHTQHGTTNPPKQPLVKATAPQVRLGNDLAQAVGAGKPGADRTVHRSGSQGFHSGSGGKK